MLFDWKQAKSILRFIRQIGYFPQEIWYRFRSVCSFKPDFHHFQSEMKFLPDHDGTNRTETHDLLSKRYRLIHDADLICAHKFEILGSSMYFEGKIEWNRDLKSGFEWPPRFYKKIRLIDPSNSADVKVPWELSRFHHLTTLGEAYRMTGDVRYSREFQDQITDWIQSNRIWFSVNWTCAMEAAIRSVNWIAGYFYFKDAPNIDSQFWHTFYKSLFQHGCFIARHLENRSKHTNNHYIADLTGLVWLGLFFKDMPISGSSRIARRAGKWLKAGIDGIDGEMSVQVNQDGTHYEASTYYHKYVAEMFLLTDMICRNNGVKISGSFSTKLEKMCEFIMDLIKPDGMSPLIGDADDGRLLILTGNSNRSAQDFRPVLAAAGAHYKREDYQKIASYVFEDTSRAVETSTSCAKETEPILYRSKAYRDGGYYFLKNKNIFCLIRCGPLSCGGQGGHSHNDQLSFILSVCGKDFFVDPGTYVYAADYSMRNLFRSTGVHNTLIIEGLEQNDFRKQDLFAMGEQSFSECVNFLPESFTGRHFGYCEKTGLIHKRRLILRESGITVEDILEGNPKRPVKGYLNFTLDTKVKISSNNHVIELENGDCRISLSTEKDSDIRLEDGFISKAYGMKEKTKRIIIGNIQVNKPFKIEICIERQPQWIGGAVN